MNLKKILASLMMISVISSCMSSMAAADVDTSKIPNTNRTFSEYNTSFLSVTGYAKGHVNDRSEYVGTDKYRTVSNELEFFQALKDAQDDKVKVIEITEDLNLGYNELSPEAKELGFASAYAAPGVYYAETPVYTNLLLEQSGVSKIDVTNIDGLTIFSQKGNTINHATFKLQSSCNDIIIRNLKFDDMWQWDDTGNYKAAGWAFIKVNGATNVWLDHCSFTIAADGNVDLENGASGVTISWCKFGEETTRTPSNNSPIYRSVSYMEMLYQNEKVATQGKYWRFRNGNATVSDIMAYSAYHSKCTLVGSGDKDYKDDEVTGDKNGNHRLRITLAYNKYTNIGTRIPLLRQGSGHVFNCFVDGMNFQKLKREVSIFGTMPAGTGFMNARNGACLAADTCELYGISGAYGGYEIQQGEGMFKGVRNHVVIVNSRYTDYSGNSYTGSSWDNNGDNPMAEADQWVDKATIGKFAWSSSIIGVENMKKASPKYPFSYSYAYDEMLPYDYQCVELDDVKDVITENSGAFVYELEAKDWLRTEYSVSETLPMSDGQQKVTGIKTNVDELYMAEGDIYQLAATISPGHAMNKNVIYKSSDDSVVTITDAGIMTCTGLGEAEITVTSADSGVSATVKVFGCVPVKRLTVKPKKSTLSVGESLELKVSVVPEEATFKDVVYSSTDTSVATVDENGVVKAVGAGSANIKVESAKDSSVYAYCQLTVDDDVITPTDTVEPEYTLGDANQDGNIDAKDALVVLKHAAKIEVISDEVALLAANVTKDEKIDASDALEILKYAANIIESFN